MKTLKQLWNEQNGPFWAISHDKGISYNFYCALFTPDGSAIGWSQGGSPIYWRWNEAIWEHCEDPSNPKPVFRLYKDVDCSVLYASSDLMIPGVWTDITEQIAAALKPYLMEKK